MINILPCMILFIILIWNWQFTFVNINNETKKFRKQKKKSIHAKVKGRVTSGQRDIFDKSILWCEKIFLTLLGFRNEWPNSVNLPKFNSWINSTDLLVIIIYEHRSNLIEEVATLCSACFNTTGINLLTLDYRFVQCSTCC